MTAVYVDRHGISRCIDCSHVSGHPVPCGARPFLGSRPCACPAEFANTSHTTTTEAGRDSTMPASAPIAAAR